MSRTTCKLSLGKNDGKDQWPIFYMSMVFFDEETWYFQMEKLVYALVVSVFKFMLML